MKTQRRHCKCCGRETLHDLFKDIWGGKKAERSSLLERLFFGVATVGLSELDSKRARCQVCNTVVRP
jgi:uncharacterized protein with PIN domain